METSHAKFTLKYSYEGSDEYSPTDITFEIPGDATIDQMLFNFQCFLKACGFIFEGDFVQSHPEDKYEGCMADWDENCGLEEISSSLEKDDWNNYFKAYNDEKIENDKKLKEWNEGIAKLENDLKAKRDIEQQAYERASRNAAVVKNNWVHGMCNPPSPDWKVKNMEGDLHNIMNKLNEKAS